MEDKDFNEYCEFILKAVKVIQKEDKELLERLK